MLLVLLIHLHHRNQAYLLKLWHRKSLFVLRVLFISIIESVLIFLLMARFQCFFLIILIISLDYFLVIYCYFIAKLCELSLFLEKQIFNQISNFIFSPILEACQISVQNTIQTRLLFKISLYYQQHPFIFIILNFCIEIPLI